MEINEASVDFESKGPRTVQKTVRVPVVVLKELEKETKKAGISVPRGITRILESWHSERIRAHWDQDGIPY